MYDLLAGRRRQGTVVNLALAAAANAALLYQISNFAAQQGTKTFKLKRLKIRNNGTGINTWVHIGTGIGGAFVEAIPPLYIINNNTDDYVEGDLPEVEFSADMRYYVDAVGAGSFDVQAEVEEIG